MTLPQSCPSTDPHLPERKITRRRYGFRAQDGSVKVTEIVPGTWREHRTVAILPPGQSSAMRMELIDALQIVHASRTDKVTSYMPSE